MTCLCCADADMVPLSEFVPFVSPSLTEAPDPLIEQFIRQAAIDLCRKTTLLKDEVLVDLQAMVHDYTFAVDNPCVIPRAVGEVRVCGGRPLPRLKRRPMPGECDPAGYWLQLPGEVYIIPHPHHDMRDGLSIEVVLQPSQDADSLPRLLYDEYAEVLAEGALSRLLLLKTASWYDTSAAGIAMKRYNSGVSAIRVSAKRGDSTQPLIAKAPRWV